MFSPNWQWWAGPPILASFAHATEPLQCSQAVSMKLFLLVEDGELSVGNEFFQLLNLVISAWIHTS